jgi:hypothetical protein
MRPDLLQRTGSFYIPILTDIEMITGTIESPATMAHFQIMLRKVPVFPRSGTMYHDKINLSHRFPLSHRFRPAETPTPQSPTLKSFSTFSYSFYF